MRKHMVRLLAAFIAFMLCIVIVPKRLLAGEVTYIVPTQYSNIQAAIDAAVISAETDTLNSYSVLVEPGTYAENITLKSNIPVRGRETARTILNGGGSGTVATANGITGISFRNFTIINASVGISVSNNAAISITNNVFQTGTSGTAVQILNTSITAAEIINNTFYQNNIAISSTVNVTIKNNIFYNNTTHISPNTLDKSYISYNAFNDNNPQGPDLTGTTNIFNVDPLFVATADRDFHLKQGSPCIDAGDNTINDLIDSTRSDIGAYGGNNNLDSIPFPVSGLTVQDTSTPPSYSIKVSWSPNNCYLIGGYKVYYGTASRTYGTPIDTLSSALTSTTITGLTPPTPSAPVGDPGLRTEPGDEKLILTWNNADGDTGYEIRYDYETSPPPLPPLSPNPTTFVVYVEDTTTDTVTYTISGLVNLTRYTIVVTPYAQATYYIAVTAYYDTASKPESEYSSPEASMHIGDKAYGTSSSKTDFPEPLSPYPNLPDKGCFIATAAFGYYSAPQVQALREFRDRYFQTTRAGRAFVRWYYQYSPAAARFINDHSWLKPAVRGALMPAVAGAIFMTKTSVLTKIFIVISIGLLVIILLRKNRPDKSSL